MIVPLDCSLWLGPFLTVSSLVLAVLVFWARSSAEVPHNRLSETKCSYDFKVSLSLLWIYIAMFFSIMAIIGAFFSCPCSGPHICSWVVSFILMAVFMLGLFIGGEILRALAVSLGKAKHDRPSLTIDDCFAKCLAGIVFMLFFVGLYLIALSMTGLMEYIGYMIGVILIGLAFAILISMLQVQKYDC